MIVVRKRVVKKKCPICSKILKFNYPKMCWECPKIKTKNDKKFGCGFFNNKIK